MIEGQNVSASLAPKANEVLAKAKFYAEIGKREKRPGFGRQSECDCWVIFFRRVSFIHALRLFPFFRAWMAIVL